MTPVYVQEKPISPTEIDTFLSCKRKWAFKYLLKIFTPQHPAAAVGTRVHKILEDYLCKGTAPDRNEVMEAGGKKYFPGKIAFAMLKTKGFPPAGSCPEGTETEFEFSFEGVKFHGRRDLKRPELGKVNDFKTTADVGKYAKSEEDLGTDSQAIIYANSMYADDDDHPTYDTVETEWIYGQTRGSAVTKVVAVTFTEDDAYEAMEAYVLPAAREIIQLRGKHKEAPIDPKSLAPTPEECEKYGGCPFKGRCKLTSGQRLRGIMKSRAEIMESLRQKRLAKEAKAGKPAAAEAEEETSAEEDESTESAAATQAKGLAALKAAQRKATKVEEDDEEETPSVGGALLSPNDSDEEEAAPSPPKKRGRKPKALAGPNPPEADEVPEEAPKAKSKVSVQEYAETAFSAAQGNGDAKRALKEMDEEVNETPARKAFTLYIDCEPLRSSKKVYLHDLITPAIAIINEEAGVAHYSLIDFGKGKGILAAQLKENLDAAPLPKGTALCMTMWTDEGKACYQTLVEMASEIVIGR